MTMKVNIIALACIACATHGWHVQAAAGPMQSIEFAQSSVCAGSDQGSCREKREVQGIEETSLLQVNMLSHEQVERTKVMTLAAPITMVAPKAMEPKAEAAGGTEMAPTEASQDAAGGKDTVGQGMALAEEAAGGKATVGKGMAPPEEAAGGKATVGKGMAPAEEAAGGKATVGKGMAPVEEAAGGNATVGKGMAPAEEAVGGKATVGKGMAPTTPGSLKVMFGLAIGICTTLIVLMIANQTTKFSIPKAPIQKHIFAIELWNCINMGVVNAYLVPLAYDVAQSLGSGAAVSGLMLSMDAFGCLFGQLCAFFMWRHLPYSRVRTWLLFAPTQMILVWVFTVGVFTSSAFSDPVLVGVLLTNRFLMGFFYSSISMIDTITVEVSNDEEKGLVALLTVPFCLVGSGMGPMVTSLVITILGASSSTQVPATDNMCGCMCLLMVVYGFLTLALSCVLPSNLEIEEEKEDGGDVANLPPADETSKKRFYAIIVVAIGLNYFVFNCVEMGTALLMEVEFGWNEQSVGFGMSTVFFICVITCTVSALLQQFGDPQMGVYFLRIMMFVSLPACFVLFKTPMWGDPAPWFQIYIADILLYPSIMAVFNVSFGWALMNVGPKGSWNSTESVLLGLFVLDGLVRTPTSPLVRAAIDWGGRNAYATVVSAVTVAAMALSQYIQSSSSSYEGAIEG